MEVLSHPAYRCFSWLHFILINATLDERSSIWLFQWSWRSPTRIFQFKTKWLVFWSHLIASNRLLAKNHEYWKPLFWRIILNILLHDKNYFSMVQKYGVRSARWEKASKTSFLFTSKAQIVFSQLKLMVFFISKSLILISAKHWFSLQI